MRTKFYYHYDKTKERARLVVGDTEYFLDDIICMVPTHTERRDTSPRFVVVGKCEHASIHGGSVAILK